MKHTNRDCSSLLKFLIVSCLRVAADDIAADESEMAAERVYK